MFRIHALITSIALIQAATNQPDPFITILQNNSHVTLVVNNHSGPKAGQPLQPPVGFAIAPGANYGFCLFDYLILDLHDGDKPDGQYLGTASVNIKTAPDGNKYLTDANGLLEFAYDKDHSTFPGGNPWDYRRAYNITCTQSLAPIVTNKGWSSGMGNSSAEPTDGEDFWLQDYGMDEQGRWFVEDGAICQSTRPMGGVDPATGYKNQGSRAYPAALKKDGVWSYSASKHGAGFTGVWQIAMKPGSKGSGSFCETFYLSERHNMAPGPKNYTDGSGTCKGGLSREIDIMETKWKPTGPQANLPTAGGSQWGMFQNQKMGEWSDIGGLPAQDFVTFGCLIRKNEMWMYGYKQDGSSWYASKPIAYDSSYNQKSPFVPYIGTWHDASIPSKDHGGFATCYKDFVYLEADNAHIAGKNPRDNPEAFGPALVNALK